MMILISDIPYNDVMLDSTGFSIIYSYMSYIAALDAKILKGADEFTKQPAV